MLMVGSILEGEAFNGGASSGLDEFLVLMQFIYYIAHTLKLTTIFFINQLSMRMYNPYCAINIR